MLISAQYGGSMAAWPMMPSWKIGTSNAPNRPAILKAEFIVREEQMGNDFRTLQNHLNVLWEKPIGDLVHLLYSEPNEVLLGKYNLELTDGSDE